MELCCIGYSLQALWNCEKHYTQIEKENLSMVFGVKHFQEYLYGCRSMVINNHKPLKSIFDRSIIPCPPHIQKFFPCLQKYNFKPQCSPGKDMLVSDILIRSHLSHSKPSLLKTVQSIMAILYYRAYRSVKLI